jgi:HK97 family phage portal protein
MAEAPGYYSRTGDDMSMLFSASPQPEARAIDGHAFYSTAEIMGSGEHAALRHIAVYAAVSLIADSVACLPVHAYKYVGGVSKRLEPQPTIVAAPQLVGSRISWIYQAVASLCLRGNAYGLTQVERNGYAEKVVWLHPDRVTVDETGAVPRYLYNGKEVDRALITHMSMFTMPGSCKGLNPIELHRVQIEKGLAADKYGADYFRRGVAPIGVLRNVKQEMKPGEAENAKRKFKAAVAGRDIFATGADWEWSAIPIAGADAAFLESISASATQIAAMFRVAPEDIGGKTGHSRQYSTLAMDESKFNTRTLMAYTARLEEALRGLMRPNEYAKFNLDARVRADIKERYEAHEIAMRIGLETQDEGRLLEDKPPLTPQQIQQWRDWYARPTSPATQRRAHNPEETP